MPPTITDLAFRVALIRETLNAHADWPERIAKSGLSSARLKEGRTYLVEALDRMGKVSEHVDDHTVIEQGRRAVTEVAHWHETYASFWSRALAGQVDEKTWRSVTGADIQGPDAELTVLMQAWRFVSSVRAFDGIYKPLLKARPRLLDELQRGLVVCNKAAKLLNKQHSLRGDERRHGVGAADLEVTARELARWIEDFTKAATACFAREIPALGLLGIVPDEVGLSLGGVARDVILHERAQGERPSGRPAQACEQWGIGTSGNRENYWQR